MHLSHLSHRRFIATAALAVVVTAARAGAAQDAVAAPPSDAPPVSAPAVPASVTPLPVATDDVPPSTAAAPRPPLARDGYPLAGRAGEYFYLRDADDDFRVYLQGRAHVDGYAPFGPGVGRLGPGQPKPTFFLRRARVELSGEFLHRWQWTVAGDWGRSAVDNPNGTAATLSCAVDPKTGDETCSPRSSSVEAASPKPQPTDVFINYRVAPELNVEIGQMKIPFTSENCMSENVSPFLESAMAVRALGAPNLRDIGAMVWGEAGGRFVHYAVGLFNGDGPNRPNQDANGDVIGRVFLHPFASAKGAVLEGLQVGVSARYGVRSVKDVGYDVSSLTTQGGYPFWKPTYTDSAGNLVHILPSSAQTAAAAELYWPIGPVDLAGELVAIDEQTREARDGHQLASPSTERSGTRRGYSYYAQLSFWLAGDRQFVRRPGYGDPAHLDFTKPLQPSRDSIEALVRFEQLDVSYTGASRGGALDAKTPDGDVKVNAVTFGVNYWATRRVRVAVNYGLYLFPGSEPTSASTKGGPQQGASQRALAPAQQLAKGVDDAARDSGHALHELGLRVAVGF